MTNEFLIGNPSTAMAVKRLIKENQEIKAEIERLRAALTPSGATKAAYGGEFTFRVCIGYEDDTEIYDTITVPWTTIKEIMAAIRARVALEQNK